MAREHVRGAVNKAKDVVKNAIGKVTRNRKLQTEETADKVKGSVQSTAGEVKDTAWKGTR